MCRLFNQSLIALSIFAGKKGLQKNAAPFKIQYRMKNRL